MMQTATPPSSDQQPLRADVLAENAASIRKLEKRLIGDVIEIGRLLSECKQVLGHGKWLPWIEHELRWNERTARNFISVYQFARSKSANFSDLRLGVSAFYLLAAPSTPEEARDKVISLVETGGAVPGTEVKRIIEETKQHVEHRAEPRVTIREVLDRSGYSVVRKLSPFEWERLLRRVRKGGHSALEEAEARTRLPKEYRRFLDAMDVSDIAAKAPMRKIVEAIPDKDRPAVVVRTKNTADFYSKLHGALMRDENSRKMPNRFLRNC
jgi:Protein of unknown function (DUF3102)